jgi:hypothetical protein
MDSAIPPNQTLGDLAMSNATKTAETANATPNNDATPEPEFAVSIRGKRFRTGQSYSWGGAHGVNRKIADQIMAAVGRGEKRSDVAAKYGTVLNVVSNIVNGHVWGPSWKTGPPMLDRGAERSANVSDPIAAAAIAAKSATTAA